MKTSKLRNIPKVFLIFIAALVFFFIWGFCFYFDSFYSGLDPSWQIGLSLAKVTGMQWGKDIAFTYGPLFELFAPKAVLDVYTKALSREAIFMLVLGLNLVIASVKATIVTMVSTSKNSLYRPFLVAMSIIYLCSSMMEYLEEWYNLWIFLLLLIFYQLYLVLCKKKPASWHEAAANILFGFVFAMLTLIKFSYFAVGAVMCVFFSLIYLWYKKPLYILVLCISSVGSTILLWLASGQALVNLPRYFYTGFLLSSAYSEAMSLPFIPLYRDDQYFVFSVIFLLLYVAVFFLLVYRRKWFAATAFFLPSAYIFLAFKEYFVRMDGWRTARFLEIVPIVMIYILYVFSEYHTAHPVVFSAKKFEKKCLQGCSIALVVMLLLYSPPIFPKAQFSELGTTMTNYDWLKENGYTYNEDQGRQGSLYLNTFQYYEPLVPLITHDETVDIFPVEISALYYYNLNWLPRPVIQSYSAYSTKLDDLNAAHYARVGAEKVIFELSAIDGRYFAFDEPATFRELLTRYQVVANENNKLLLERGEKQFTESLEIARFTARVGEDIQIPLYEDAYVFMEIHADTTLLGQVTNFLYKTPPNTITLNLANGLSLSHRFIRGTAPNGLFISKYIANSSDLKNVFDRTFDQDILSFSLTMDTRMFNKDFEVVFYAIPFDEDQTQVRFVFENPLPKGEYAVYYDIGDGFSNAYMKQVFVEESIKELIVSLPANQSLKQVRLDFPAFSTENLILLSVDCGGDNLVKSNSFSQNGVTLEAFASGLRLSLFGDEDPFIFFSLT